MEMWGCQQLRHALQTAVCRVTSHRVFQSGFCSSALSGFHPGLIYLLLLLFSFKINNKLPHSLLV